MTRKAIGVGEALLLDESGQTMLEYVVIIIFVITCTIIFFRLMKRIVHAHVMRASASFDTD